jgi:hypothetical protein
VARARALTGDQARASFVAADAIGASLTLDAADLALGLHACGELGDHVVRAAAAAGARVALVACCPQKIRGDARAGLCDAAPSLPREALGLANVVASDVFAEASRATALRAREQRHALRILLARAGVAASPGEEMRGVNRKRARDPFDVLAARAFAARGLAAPRAEELAASSTAGRALFAAVRRLSLPRAAIARLVEVTIALDRAAFLEGRGYATRLVELVPRDVTPRNVALLAART